MNENLIQYIWQFQLFNKMDLTTVESIPITILRPGSINENQGPDFLNAKIFTDNATWIGSIEIHIQSSDWDLHGHSSDLNYNNVILHVVWNHDKDLNLPFPTLELKHLVPKQLLVKYQSLQSQSNFIPCEKNIAPICSLQFEKWKEILVVERLQRKAELIKDELLKSQYNWKLVFWYMLARAFGGNLNGEAFVEVLKSIPLNILIRSQNSTKIVEAILMGQAGLLNNEFSEEYPIQLKKEYLFYQHKYKLNPPKVSLLFLRMRPSNFPSIRLAQFAAFVCKNANFISEIIQPKNKSDLEYYFDYETTAYWDNHYCFDHSSKNQKKKIGKTLLLNIFINAIIPFQFAYGVIMGKEIFVRQAIDNLNELEPEKNKIISRFIDFGLKPQNAFDSQFLLQLKNEYCNYKKCLSCQIGYQILNKDKMTNL